MPNRPEQYEFQRSDPGIFTEVYFPKRASYMGALYDSLEKGFKENVVRRFMIKNIETIYINIKENVAALHPSYYDLAFVDNNLSLTLEKFKERINTYKSPFAGYSIYSVDGTFFDKDSKTRFEETTLVVRLIFRFKSQFESVAKKNKWIDVLRAISRWIIRETRTLDYIHPLNDSVKKDFFRFYRGWNESKREFARNNFNNIAIEAHQWYFDCGLFVSAYLIRNFVKHLQRIKRVEKEVWAATFFDLNLNVFKAIEPQEIIA